MAQSRLLVHRLRKLRLKNSQIKPIQFPSSYDHPSNTHKHWTRRYFCPDIWANSETAFRIRPLGHEYHLPPPRLNSPGPNRKIKRDYHVSEHPLHLYLYRGSQGQLERNATHADVHHK